MVKHIILWNLKEELTAQERVEAAERVKTGLEGLLGQIDGLLEIWVETAPLSSSSADIMLFSSFATEEALKGYQKNPKHLAVAQYVRSVTCNRMCMDFEVNKV